MGFSCNGGGWKDANQNVFPDWVEIDFNATKSIDRVVVCSLQDNTASPVEPALATAFTLYGAVDFTVQGFDGTNWVTLGTVTGNNLVKRAVSFMPFTTDRIRVNVNNALSGWSRLTEIEAWGY
jgi:hypothetical protein